MGLPKLSIFLFAALCAVAISHKTFAAEENTSTAETTHSDFDNDWHFLVAVPLWLPAISGDVATSHFSDIPVSSSIGDLVSHLNFALMAHAEARKSRIGFGVDMIYVNDGDTLDTGRALPALQTFNLGLKQVISEGFMFYRLVQAGDPRNPYTFDLLGGARYIWTESELNNFSDSNYWVDLMLGIRGSYAFGEHFSLRGRSDYAFLGSKFTYNLIGEAAWTFSDKWTVTAGYRALNINYENSSKQRTWDINYHGPVVGAVFSW
jgi:hypothetical protein